MKVAERDFALKRIPGGDESVTYILRHDADDYILRVNRNRAGFEKDTLAYRHFACKELPVPEIMAVHQADDGSFYCISRKMPGRTLQSLTHRELKLTLAPTLRVMRAIASSPVEVISGFGPFDAAGEAPFASWREFLLSFTERRGIDPSLSRIIRCLAPFCPEMRRLVHGDFGSNNVLTDGRQITGVLDWSEAMIGDPLWDVANVLFWRGWLICMELLAQYVEKRMHSIPNWRERVLCYQACIAIRELTQ